MESNVRLQTSVGLLLSCLACASMAVGQRVETTQENIEKGQAIYKKRCLMCHGERWMGDGPAGKRMKPKPLSFADREKMAKLDDDHLFKRISQGEKSMPAFDRKLREEQSWMVIHYIRTLSK